MEVNKEEALRCLSIAQKHRSASNFPTALKFASKSVSLYSTPEGEALVTIIQREIKISESSSNTRPTNGPNGSNGTSGMEQQGESSRSARSTGVEEHVSESGTHRRMGHDEKGKSKEKEKEKREYTVKQMEVVKRVKMCKHHQYYEILSLEKTCTENDVKKAYKKLALQLHPDKNGAPGADEAFKMISKAFQVLSDSNLRSIYDSNPSVDPTQRGNPSSSGSNIFRTRPAPGGGGFQGDINPEDLFNMFFGGGLHPQGNVFTFGGPGIFQAQFGGGGGGGPMNQRYRQRNQTNENTGPTSPLMALLPLIILFLFGLISIIPSLFSGPNVPDPKYNFEPSDNFDLGRTTWNWGVPYWVNGEEWEGSKLWQSVPETRRDKKDAAMYSSKVRVFERGVESVYAGRLRNECETFSIRQQHRISQEAGFFGFGADYEKIRSIQSEKSPACEQLRQWGLTQQAW
ncbi:hypothetical protein TREMEDRAFT_69910 [Tremella mesenterica DSM 1558]|uniref:uncharacterized protein n=1 Tax=Tremella mesenterica (strain ATCC 24925 / CBS 8224 / DSM 1558 / NBRC 9311 / NRRL Y-6157 / RJB 2259-6 / UBC 559-6) TaxID=578456 RepID=UPI0003F49282|nr:uncharacterized protein TREMEDRAFT_69910 [Tremella mesenterica DSM 1558]EIW66930.1 hypothetical protein TREMEDRAFT_69910 [Tremella mesenterica DSM 1558]